MAEESLLAQAQAASKAREYARSIELYSQAVDADPTAEALAGRASLHNKLQNYMEAAADASHAIELDDKLAAAHKEKGIACYNLVEYESAMDAFEAAAALEPTKSIHKMWVNMCKVQLGEELPPTPIAQGLQPPGQPLPQRPSISSGGKVGGEQAGGKGGKGITLSGDQLKAFLAEAQAGNLGPALGPQGRLPPEAEEEVGSEQPTHVTADDPEFSKYWKAPISASVVASISDKPQGARYRHQWFQSGERVEVDVLAKGLKKEQVGVTIEPRRLRVVTISAEGQEDYDLDLALHGEIVPAESCFQVLGTKVEIKLKKAAADHWPQLEEGDQQQGATTPAAAAAAQAEAAEAVVGAVAGRSAAPAGPKPAYPYAGKKVDWDKFAKEVQVEEKEEKLEGDQALMKFFRELYDGGDEDTRRAMVKSMQESGGTALSMNWGEVGKKDFAKKGKDGEEEEDWGRRKR